MMAHQIKARHYHSGKPLHITMSDGRFVSVQEGESAPAGDNERWIAPGFVDLQINGCGGYDFNTPKVTEQDIYTATEKIWEQGVTSYYPTVITNADETVTQSLRTIAAACRHSSRTASAIAGIHVEGPFISPHDGARGAHSRTYVKAPDWDLFRMWIEASEGRVRIVTLSPEWDEAPAFIAKCVEEGITVSIGHTSATPEQIREAIAAGASMSTHLGNGAHAQLPRHPNYIWEQLASDELWTCAIADGFHLPASVLKVFYRVKPGRLILVSDALYVSGLQPGTYSTDIGTEVVLTPEGKLHTAGNPATLAGSAQMPLTGVVNMAKRGICSLPDAWDLASLKPAECMQLEVAAGMAEGAPADAVVYEREEDGNVTIREVWKEGRMVFGSGGKAGS